MSKYNEYYTKCVVQWLLNDENMYNAVMSLPDNAPIAQVARRCQSAIRAAFPAGTPEMRRGSKYSTVDFIAVAKTMIGE